MIYDVLVDQLPVLTGLQRSLEELIILQPAGVGQGSKMGLLVEEVR
jgi:hypothetical protein